MLRGVPYALDFDDAIFHNYDLHRAGWVRRVFGRRIDYLMENAHLVVAGNSYLAARAIAAGAKRVEIIPTVVDLARYATKSRYTTTKKPIIVWIGSPSSVQYLLELVEPLSELANRQAFTLRVIGGGTITIQNVEVESLPWSLETEVALIAECDIGIMPLRNTPWEQGKCAYKLIQYMACGLPTVASAIGANCDAVIQGKTGFLAETPMDWVEKLALLLSDARLRERLGKVGRMRVETEYSLQKTAPRLVRILTEISEEK
jgi:glycosyltransferase involved in cell wall biosynthesis